jgi:uncharacterized integral membrane protein
MSNLWTKIKVWTKVVLISLILIYVLIFIIKNSGQQVQFWYWFNNPLRSSLLLFTLITFAAGAIFALLFRMTYRTIAQLREMYSGADRDKEKKEFEEMKQQVAKMQTGSPTTEPSMKSERTEGSTPS